jgi:hypothetical protein
LRGPRFAAGFFFAAFFAAFFGVFRDAISYAPGKGTHSTHDVCMTLTNTPDTCSGLSIESIGRYIAGTFGANSVALGRMADPIAFPHLLHFNTIP